MSYTPWMVVKTSALGDVVQTLESMGPFCEAFKSEDIGIEWVTEAAIAPLVALHPMVKMVHVISTKQWKKSWYRPSVWTEVKETFSRLRHTSYAAALDLQGNVKSALVMRSLKTACKVGFDRQSVSEWPAALGLDVQLHTHHFKRVRDVYSHGFAKTFEQTCGKSALLKPFKASELLWSEYNFSTNSIEDQEYGVVALGSRWINKQPQKVLAIPLVKTLLESTKQMIYLASGSESERQLAQEVVQEIHHPRIKLLPSMALVQYAYTLYKSKWVLSADSLPLHLASWLDVPSFGLFGPSNDFYYGPIGSAHGSWQGNCPYNIRFTKRCPRLRSCATGACLRQAPQKPVIEVLEDWIRNQVHHPS